MKAIISVYKSEILKYIKDNKLKREDVHMICSNAEVEAEGNAGKFDEVVLLSTPLGVPANVPYLESVLLKKKAAKPAPKAAPKPAPAAKPEKPVAKKVIPKKAPAKASKADGKG